MPYQPFGAGPPPGPYGPPYPYAVAAPTNGLAIAALVLACTGFGPIGAIMGHVALRQLRERGEQGEQLAKIAIILGWVFFGLWVLCCGVSFLPALSEVEFL